MPKLKLRIGPILSIFMIVTALILDGLKALLSFIFMGWVVSIWAQLTFWFWFTYLGVSFLRPGKMQGMKVASMSVPVVLGALPVISALPAWTTGVIVNLAAVYAEDLLESLTPTTLQVIAKAAKVVSKKKRGATETGASAETGPKAKEGQPKKEGAGEQKGTEKKKEPEKVKMEEIKPKTSETLAPEKKPIETARDLNRAKQNKFLEQLQSTSSEDKNQQELKQREDRHQQLTQILKDKNNPNIDKKRRLSLLKELNQLNEELPKDKPETGLEKFGAYAEDLAKKKRLQAQTATDNRFIEPGYVEFERKTGEMEPVETESDNPDDWPMAI